MKMQLLHLLRFAIFATIFLAGCRAARDVAVTSFRVVDAPANYIWRHIDDDEGTTTAVQSDVVTPGQPVPTSPPQGTTSRRRTTVDSDAAVDAEQQSQSSQRATTSAQTTKIPYAKPVPGKPGYVYSPFDPNGGYVDVTGYASGSKAKDPYSGKIFIVP